MLKLIPEPYTAELTSGVCNTLNGFAIDAPENWQKDTEIFLTFMSRCGIKNPGGIKIEAVCSPDMNEEEYTLTVDKDDISIAAGGGAGYMYALESLKQLHFSYDAKIPCVKIHDKPRFAYRGFMLDVGRYFFPLSEVFRFIDLMAAHKLNFFHIHLTEDQGWRIEIKKYPLLTQEGSKRTHTNFNCKPHGGYYTQEEIRQLVEYCHDRHIRVIPEIDMPGHMQAALHCYPQLGCFNRKLPVATHWGVKHDILCAGKDFTLSFVCDVLDEVISLFPDGYVHIGADEAVKTRWKLCPDCQAKIKELGLKDENELQAHFINRVCEHIASKGYKTIMWNEHEISGKVSPDVIWTVWDVTEKDVPLMTREMDNGRKLINASSVPNYLDLTYNKCSLKKIYTQPLILGREHENLEGLEAPLWTELVPDIDNAFYKTFPRLGAFSEAVWTKEENRNYDSFIKKIPTYYRLLNKYGVKRLPSVKRANPGKITGAFEQLWFNRCQLCWHGLHNLIDNAKVARYVKKTYRKK